MNSCYVGRGSLLVSVIGTSGGFFTLSGESELTLNFQEDNESIFDARSGANERVDWYVRNYRATLNAQCFRIEPAAVSLLLKASRNIVAADFAPIILPDPIQVGRDYVLRPNLVAGSVTVADAALAVVPVANYTVDLEYGLIRFSATPGVQPYAVALASDAYESLSLNGFNQVFVKALFKGVDKASDRKVMAEFYRLAVDISEQFDLIKKEFSSMNVRLQATPDLTQPLDPQLGQYGRLILL